jgi:HlyD family secretion protein
MDMPTPGARTETEPAPPIEPPKHRAPSHSRLPSIIVVVVAIVIAALSVWYLVRGEPLLVQGEVDATRFDIAARVDGRVGEICFEA